MRRLRICLFVLGSFLGPVLGAAGPMAQPARADLLDELSDTLPGFWENRTQWEDAGRPGATDQTRHVLMNADIAPAAVPGLGDAVFYLQQIQDDFAPHVYRQGLLVLTSEPGGAVRMSIRAFADENLWLDAHLDPARLSTLREADLLPADPGCDLFWRRAEAGLVAETAPDACRIDSARLGTTLRRMERWTLDGNRLTQYDRVERPDGTVVHESPAGRPFVLDRWPGLPSGGVPR